MRAKEAEAQAERARLEAERAARQAEEARVAATQQQAVHEDRLRTADEVDPRVDTRSEDYAPGAGTSDPHTVLDADDPRHDGSDGGAPRLSQPVASPRRGVRGAVAAVSKW